MSEGSSSRHLSSAGGSFGAAAPSCGVGLKGVIVFRLRLNINFTESEIGAQKATN